MISMLCCSLAYEIHRGRVAQAEEDAYSVLPEFELFEE